MWDGGREATIHGDLHFGQLFLGPALEVSAVIDVDTAGAGTPADDTAAFVSHAITSAILTPAPRDARVWKLARQALARWGARDDADAFRARTATHLLGHSLGAIEVGAADRGARLLRAAASVVTGADEDLSSI
jgi:aminoglycoside phosphotransferase (APT) family kinase protein